MKFTPKNIKELVPLEEHLAGGCPIIRTRRRFSYLIYETDKTELLESNAVIQLAGAWYIWPAALVEWVEAEAAKTRRQFGTKHAA